jgi:hypothetical protein
MPDKAYDQWIELIEINKSIKKVLHKIKNQPAAV